MDTDRQVGQASGLIRRDSTSECTYAADLVLNGWTYNLWFDCETLSAEDVLNDDVALVASVLMWMEAGVDVHVQGTVTQELLENLDELQDVWHAWQPTKYRVVKVSADKVVSCQQTSKSAVLAYSGGLDAQFTLLRHVRELAGHRTSLISKAVLIHGLDINLEDHHTFARASERARRCLAAESIPLEEVRTNFRSLPMAWEDAHALGIAACLHLFSAQAGIGLIASGRPYDLLLPWGSHPLTDHLLSSGAFEIRHDGAGYSRTQKAETVVKYSQTLADLRVCWQGEHLDRNCGRCEKCARTYWNLRVAGSSKPPCFADLSVPAHRVVTSSRQIDEWTSILDAAQHAGVYEAVRYARAVVLHNKVRRSFRSVKPLRLFVKSLRRS